MEKTGLEIFTLFKNKQWIREEDISILLITFMDFFMEGLVQTKCTLILTI